jgi:DNA invertase Pin-like site-specific DNA recombinase
MAYSYVRFSTPTQALGASLVRQIEAAEACAAERNLEIDTTLRDLGKSAFSGANRKGALGGFLGLIEKGAIPRGSFLLIEALDRLSREETLTALALVTDIVNAGITIITLEDRNEYSRETIKAQPHLIYVLVGKIQQANDYSERLSMRVTSGKRVRRAANLANNKPVTSMAPAWLRVVGDGAERRYELISDRVEIIREIFTALDSDVGKERIAQRLNQKKVPTFTREGQGLASKKSGKGWYASYIRKLINNRALIGEFQPTERTTANGKKKVAVGAPILGHFPEIIDPAVFERVNGLRKPAGRKGKMYRNVLTGLCRCGSCQSPMMMQVKGERRPYENRRKEKVNRDSVYLVCSSAFRKTGCTNRGVISYPPIEKAILEIASLLADVKGIFKIDDDSTKAIETDIAKAKNAKANAEKRIADALDNLGASPSPTVLKWIEKTETDIAKHDAEIAKLEKLSRKKTSRDTVATDKLVEMAQAAAAEKDEAVRYDIRARIHGILLQTVDRIDCFADRKAWLAWLGGGFMFCQVENGEQVTAVVDGAKCHFLKEDGTHRTQPTPQSILETHLNLREIAGRKAVTMEIAVKSVQ